MLSILVLGAGRSSASLIEYLLAEAKLYDWQIVVGDVSHESALQKIGDNPFGKAIVFDIHREAEANDTIGSADVVISLLPAFLHPLVAQMCLAHRKHLLTASYVSADMQMLHQDSVANNLLFLNECGLDPGLDHMSAMQVIDRIKSAGGQVTSFESFAGGLISPQTDIENPWRYKFTWNARNVVMAGQGTASFLYDGEYKYIPYQQLFKRVTPVHVEGYGDFEGYANRDSLKYLKPYGLDTIGTMLRGTLRNKGFCSAWNVLVQLGCCDDSYAMAHVETMTHLDFITAFLPSVRGGAVETQLCRQAGVDLNGDEMERLRWLGLFTNEPVGLAHGTPAQILEHILNKRWKLQAGDKDMVVMWHRFQFVLHEKRHQVEASLAVEGADEIHTAMAKTVGLPLGIAASLLLKGKITRRGIVIPITPDIYGPVLAKLATLGIALQERETQLSD